MTPVLDRIRFSLSFSLSLSLSLSLSFVVFLISCSASDPTGPEKPARRRSPVSVAASPATTAAFGITQWLIDADDAHGVVQGVDPDDAVVAQFEGWLEQSSGNKRGVMTSGATDAAAAAAAAALRYTVRKDGTLHVDEDEDGNLTRARVMAQRAMQDISKASSGLVRTAGAGGARPLDVNLLPGGSVPLSTLGEKCAACLIALLCYLGQEPLPTRPEIEQTGGGTVACAGP